MKVASGEAARKKAEALARDDIQCFQQVAFLTGG